MMTSRLFAVMLLVTAGGSALAAGQEEAVRAAAMGASQAAAAAASAAEAEMNAAGIEYAKPAAVVHRESLVASVGPHAVGNLSDPGENNVRKLYLDVSASSENLAHNLLVRDKQACRQLGAEACRVMLVNAGLPDADNPHGIGLVLILTNSAADRLIEQIIAESGKYGISVKRNEDEIGKFRPRPVALKRVERELLLAQQRALAGLKAKASNVERYQLDLKRSEIAENLQNLDAEDLKEANIEANPPQITRLYINYLDAGGTYRAAIEAGNSREREHMIEQYGTYALAAAGMAVLTSIYLGIITLAVLGLRKLARRWGLLAGAKRPAEPVAPTT